MLFAIGVLLVIFWAVALALKATIGFVDVVLVLGLVFLVAAFFQWRAGPTRRTPAA